MKGGNSYYTLTCFITRHYTQSAVKVPDGPPYAPVAPDEALIARRIGGVQAANYSTFEERLDGSIARLSRCIYRLCTKG